MVIGNIIITPIFLMFMMPVGESMLILRNLLKFLLLKF